MKIIVHTNGKTFESKATDELSAEEAKDAIYPIFEDMEKLEAQTESGFIILGRDALQSAVIELIDT